MTIDERLEKLTERHEALAQTVEVLRDLQLKNEESIARLIASSDRLDKRIDRLYNITLKIGADFYDRLLKLERESDADGN